MTSTAAATPTPRPDHVGPVLLCVVHLVGSSLPPTSKQDWGRCAGSSARSTPPPLWAAQGPTSAHFRTAASLEADRVSGHLSTWLGSTQSVRVDGAIAGVTPLGGECGERLSDLVEARAGPAMVWSVTSPSRWQRFVAAATATRAGVVASDTGVTRRRARRRGRPRPRRRSGRDAAGRPSPPSDGRRG